jgi:hypothetical protein
MILKALDPGFFQPYIPLPVEVFMRRLKLIPVLIVEAPVLHGAGVVVRRGSFGRR